MVLDALEQHLYACQTERSDALVYNSNKSLEYVSIRYIEHLAKAGVEPSVGSKCSSSGSALRSLETREAVELATLDWGSWFKHNLLPRPLGYISTSEPEPEYYKQQSSQAVLA